MKLSPMMVLTKKETDRFLLMWVQTIVGPMSTAILYQLIFGGQLSGSTTGIPGVSYAMFLIPGLVMMQVLLNAFSNSSSSLIQAKYMGNIIFMLMAPITPLSIYMSYLMSSVLRGIIVGLAVFVSICWFGANIPLAPFTLVYFLVSGSILAGGLGIIAGILCQKFDQISGVQSFVITPLIYLAGIFFNVSLFSGIWRDIAMLDPFLYIVDGFRYGFIAHSSYNIEVGAIFVGGMAIVINIVGYILLRKGVSIKH